MCPAILYTCKNDTECSNAMDWKAIYCLPSCKTVTYTSSGNLNITVQDVSCSKKCDTKAKSNNVTLSASKDIFDNQVACYDYCYKYLADNSLQITWLMIIFAVIFIFAL